MPNKKKKTPEPQEEGVFSCVVSYFREMIKGLFERTKGFGANIMKDLDK